MAADIGHANLVFGVTDETFGYIQNLEFKQTVDSQQITNGAGNVVGAAFSQKVTEVSGEYIVTAAADNGTIDEQVGTGTAITLTDSENPGDIYITESTVRLTNDNFKVVSFTGTHFPNLD